ncbi:putative protein kinase RLK-Pelle-CR4L family [Helianthus anomalus]
MNLSRAYPCLVFGWWWGGGWGGCLLFRFCALLPLYTDLLRILAFAFFRYSTFDADLNYVISRAYPCLFFLLYHLEILATNNFSHENLITEDALGKVYKGKHSRHNYLVIQRLDCKYGQGDELQNEISTIKSFQHKNIVSLFGHCADSNEKIIIYEGVHGTLSQHLSNPTLTWSRRLQICLGVARGLNHIHYDIIHCDIKSSKIILDGDWEPKIFGFERSTKYPQSLRHRLLFSHYFDTNNLTPKYDVYSFGVLLLEVLCGRKPVITNYGVEEELDDIIDPDLRKQMDTQSLRRFKEFAYKCLNQQHVQRPTMDEIVKELEEVVGLQWEHADLEHSIAADEGTSSNNLEVIKYFL